MADKVVVFPAYTGQTLRVRLFALGSGDTLLNDERVTKTAVVAASTANVTLATDVEDGDSLDGVTLSTSDRILLKDQSTATENGIYVVAASGAPTRAADMAAAADAVDNYVPVTAGGAVNGGKNFIQTADPAVVGTNNLVFAEWVAGDLATEYTNKLGLYAATVDQALAGEYDVIAVDAAGDVAYIGRVWLIEEASTFLCYDPGPISSIVAVEPTSFPVFGTDTLLNFWRWFAALSINPMTATAAEIKLRNQADSADLATFAQTDDGTTYTQDEATA